MFRRQKKPAAISPENILNAIAGSQAMIVFKPDGTILSANALFLGLMGYAESEVLGQHHSMFIPASEREQQGYADFWAALRKGDSFTSEFRRLTKSDTFVWIQGSYSPIREDGEVVAVVKVASDITARKLAASDSRGQLDAIGKAQAVIEFDLDGRILSANTNFCSAMGYDISEVVGRHHSMFVDKNYAASQEYSEFWQQLRRGTFQASEFCRLGKRGNKVWIQASYNPILDTEGVPYKVVKYATDITLRKRAVEDVSWVLQGMAHGNLTRRLDEEFGEDLEAIREAVNSTVAQFSEIVAKLLRTSRNLKTATARIMVGSNELSERTNRQAAAVEQLSAAMEQMSTTVRENSFRAESASKDSAGVLEQAREAGEVMVDANHAMERIAQASQRISDIIVVIDDIAFQTNLLALNASVEAARAGDAGRGFAVVAAEVRRLAQSAAKSSSDVKNLVAAAVAEVAHGQTMFRKAGQKLEEAVAGVTNSSGLAKEISQASEVQAGSILEMVTAIRHIDQLTQQNAALVEQTASSIARTEEQAAELDTIVEVFQIDRSDKTSLPRSVGGRAAA